MAEAGIVNHKAAHTVTASPRVSKAVPLVRQEVTYPSSFQHSTPNTAQLSLCDIEGECPPAVMTGMSIIDLQLFGTGRR